MPKLFGTSLDKYNKSCRAPHQESSKIEFAFFQIFYDFLEILQDSTIWIHYWRCTFAQGPWNFFILYKYALRLHRAPRKELGACNSTLSLGGGAAGRNLARPAALPAEERVGLVHVLTYDSLVAKVGVEGSPARARGGGRWWQPRRLGLTARRILGWAMCECSSFSKAQGRVGGGWPARGTRGRSSLARGRQWWPASSVLARGEAVAG
jgi:hypothetical protein